MATTLTTPADVISVLKDHGFDDYTDLQFLVILNEVQNDACAIEAWPFGESSTTITTSPGSDNAVNLLGGGTQILSVVNTTTGTTLIPERWDQIQKNWANQLTMQAEPQWYYFKGDVPFLYPVPDSAYVLSATVQLPPTQLSTTSDTFTWPTRHLWVIVYGALSKLFDMEDDEGMSQFYQTMMDQRMDRARQDIWTRQFDRFDTIKDIMSDDWYGY